MSRKNPHLNADGKPKHGYPSAGAGWAYINDLVDRGRMADGVMYCYPCDTCAQFHVGKNHSNTRRRRNRHGAW